MGPAQGGAGGGERGASATSGATGGGAGQGRAGVLVPTVRRIAVEWTTIGAIILVAVVWLMAKAADTDFWTMSIGLIGLLVIFSWLFL